MSSMIGKRRTLMLTIIHLSSHKSSPNFCPYKMRSFPDLSDLKLGRFGMAGITILPRVRRPAVSDLGHEPNAPSTNTFSHAFLCRKSAECCSSGTLRARHNRWPSRAPRSSGSCLVGSSWSNRSWSGIGRPLAGPGR